MGERFKILLAGVGTGGCHALGALSAQWVGAPDMVVMHTAAPLLEESPVQRRLMLGPAVTRGLSTGNDPETGRRAAEASADDLRALFAGVDLVVILTGLGGGTGSGAAPVVARCAREAGALALAVCTLPFFFEGPQRRMRAEEGAREIRQQADAVVIFPNQRLMEWVDGTTQVTVAFRIVDRILGDSIRGLWKLLSEPGLIPLDFQDLRNLIQQSGGALTMASVESSGPDRARQALAELTEHPLLEHGALLSQAKGVLVGVLGGPDLTLADLQRVMNEVHARCRPDAPIQIATAVDASFDGRLALTVILSEHAEPVAPPEKAPAPSKEETAVEPAPPQPEAAGSRKPGKRKAVQAEMTFESQGRGRFRNVEPTLLDGEDLDVPTFVRRGIQIARGP